MSPKFVNLSPLQFFFYFSGKVEENSFHVDISIASLCGIVSGIWKKETEFPHLCFENHLCTPQFRLRWILEPNDTIYDHTNTCDLILSKGIKRIYFNGDSYMRHIYQAFILTLTGNYRDGSLSSSHESHCEYDHQFSEKKCSTQQMIGYDTRRCDDKLQLRQIFGHDGACEPGDIFFWSEGNHNIIEGTHGNGESNYGNNNATAYQNHFLHGMHHYYNKFCPITVNPVNHTCDLFWVSTHQRPEVGQATESNENVRNFNIEMRHFMEAGNCGKVKYIDVFNMTEQLYINYHSEIPLVSFDQNHYAMEINLIKAQIMIYHVLRDASNYNE